MYDKKIINLPESVIDKANMSIYVYHKGRKSLDSQFINDVFDAQARCELELSKLNHWPENSPIIGVVNHG